MSDELPARWYCVSREGLATLCLNESDARMIASNGDRNYSRSAPHHAVLMGDVAAAIEACAKLCDDAKAAVWPYHDPEVKRTAETVCGNLAAAIRATIPRTDQEQA